MNKKEKNQFNTSSLQQMNCPKGYRDDFAVYYSTLFNKSISLAKPQTSFNATTLLVDLTLHPAHSILVSESNISPGILSTADMLSFKIVNVGTPPRWALDFKLPHREISHGIRCGENGSGQCCAQIV
ncbi:hypothetical protein AVEN_127854-1 [Araneus ventricosus]|uniref:Uncharacterized protein n=1 Tax=Araneus ventricosus TaxID=182803 RepID=A0A4Y1ZZ63_ARAVE|nr:hypothetical protein AVEN_127854-1 [Araneus ventricosus]